MPKSQSNVHVLKAPNLSDVERAALHSVRSAVDNKGVSQFVFATLDEAGGLRLSYYFEDARMELSLATIMMGLQNDTLTRRAIKAYDEEAEGEG